MSDLSALILCGGKSRRFGRDKAGVPFRGQPLIEHAYAVMDAVSDDVWLSTNTPEAYRDSGRPMVGDIFLDRGPLGGLHAGLGVVRHDLMAVIACDMPFASAELLRTLAEDIGPADVAVPRCRGFLEPLHAVYRRSCRGAIEEALRAGHRRIVAFYPGVSVREVPVEEPGPFRNINVVTDLEEMG